MSRETKAFVPSLYGDAQMKNHVQFFFELYNCSLGSLQPVCYYFAFFSKIFLAKMAVLVHPTSVN